MTANSPFTFKVIPLKERKTGREKHFPIRLFYHDVEIAMMTQDEALLLAVEAGASALRMVYTDAPCNKPLDTGTPDPVER